MRLGETGLGGGSAGGGNAPKETPEKTPQGESRRMTQSMTLEIPAIEGARVRKHSVRIAGHRTSVSMEDAFWNALGEIAKAENLSVNELVARIDAARTGALSSAVRVYVLEKSISAARRGHLDGG